MIQPDANGLYHPLNEEDIISLIQYAITNKLQVRVRGAAESVPGSVFTDGYNPTANSPSTRNINIMLDQMRTVTFTDNSSLVTVQAGCNLGYDPFDPTGVSKPGNGLFDQLQAHELAIPNVSDEIHQTVAGYISTASSGGSIAHSFLDAIMSIRIIDGTGKVQVFNRPNPDNPGDPFYAAAVSLGLLGIIVELTLQCIPSFNVIGQQAITPDTEAAFDVFGPGSASKPSLQTYFTSTEFTRLIWWPFPTVKRLFTWQARTMQTGDYNSQTGPPTDFHPKPYQDSFYPSFLPEGWSGVPKEIIETSTELVVSMLYSAIGNWPNDLYDLLGNEIIINGKTIQTSDLQITIQLAWPVILPHLLNVFAPCDGNNAPQQFWDVWMNGLANDTNEYSNNLLPAYRTEFWVSVAHAQQVMNMLENYYANEFFKVSNSQNNNFANSCYVVEILGAKSSPFWLSPSYDQDSIRINFYSLKQTNDDVMVYFQQFWDLFYKNKINFRLHWGYYLPNSANGEGSGYLQSQYPMWNQFNELRKTMDPNNIFLNDYWKNHLNIS